MLTFILCIFPTTVCTAGTNVSVQIPVKCEENEKTDENYSVKILPESENQGTIDKSSINLTGQKEDAFSIRYDKVGTYKYKIIQEEGSNPNIKYDKTVYNADVYVIEEDGKMFAEPIVYKNGSSEKSDSCIFENIVTITETENDDVISPDDDIVPTITGEILQDKNAATQKDTAPLNTGDENNIVWMALLMLSCIAVSGIVIMIRKSKH